MLSDQTQPFYFLATTFCSVSHTLDLCGTCESANVLREETVQNIRLSSVYFPSFGYPGTSCVGFLGCKQMPSNRCELFSAGGLV